MVQLLIHGEPSGKPSQALDYARLKATNALSFLETSLGDGPYFAGDRLTQAEIVAGTLVGRMPDLGIDLAPYPQLNRWSERLLARPSWQAIELSADEWRDFRRRFRIAPRIWQRRRRQRMVALSSVAL